ncbi:unnamed protein product [Adineta ricciae]|uniref:CDP-diacylglycerol--serine O-phosphatidyltransferase n=1 Tax=Adineta ricciae TaxID=249248 RepID=A0A815BPG2_ADIRI|nr:unnamed protein product [Adineta ricciae]CAF1273345.1 unnamed protein product [Adineta ricciae]
MSNTTETEFRSTSNSVYLKLADDYANKIRRSIPNALTLGNLACGLFSLIMTMNGLHRFAALFVFLAAVFDFFDGRVARKLGYASPIGAELDSLADVVSFGVAPTILAYSISQWSFLMIIAFFSFPLAGAWRLARFNIHPTTGHFVGLPIPAAGLSVAFLALFSYVSPLIMIALAGFMVSKVDVPKL